MEKKHLFVIISTFLFQFTEAQILKNSSASINLGYTAPSTFDGQNDPKNPSMGDFGVAISPWMAVKGAFNLRIKDTGSNRIESSAVLNYFGINAQHVATPNFEEKTKMRFLYGGFDIHTLPSFRGTKFKADIGLGLYYKILSTNSNENFDPNDNTKLIGENSRPTSPDIIINSYLGLGYCREKASYWIHYNTSLNSIFKVAYFKSLPLQQLMVIGVKFKLR